MYERSSLLYVFFGVFVFFLGVLPREEYKAYIVLYKTISSLSEQPSILYVAKNARMRPFARASKRPIANPYETP